MFRHFATFGAIAILGIWVATGCASKSSTAGAGSAGTETDVTQSDTSDTGGKADLSSFEMPIVHFEFNAYTIPADDRGKLQTAADYLKSKSGVKVTIEGHCDERGSNEYNLALGERRALAVKNYLKRLGVEESRLATISYGEERPADPSGGEIAWAKNRRGELIANQ